jgi:hypothetical protein
MTAKEKIISQLPIATYFVGHFNNKVLAELAKTVPEMTIWELYLVTRIN